MYPIILDLEEEEEVPKSISEQLHEIWQTVQLQSVWRPMAFVYIFNLFQVWNYTPYAIHRTPFTISRLSPYLILGPQCLLAILLATGSELPRLDPGYDGHPG
ncbi:hypothetical protein EON63_21855 [archaeon]|nr:MAG: hypothetical protein EON63_21855 [archaeon]